MIDLPTTVLTVLRTEPLNYQVIRQRVIEIRQCSNSELDYCLIGLIRIGKISRAGGVYVLKLTNQEG